MPSKTKTKTRPVIPMPRVFSTAGVHPYDEIEWEKRDVEITDDGGKSIFKQLDVEVPKSWSPLATKIVVSKYFYGDIAKGLDPRSGGRESSVKQLIDRVADTFTQWAVADGYLSDNAQEGLKEKKPDGLAVWTSPSQIFNAELKWLLVNQYAAFNSPVWFNVGLHHKYGVGAGRGQGNWVWDRTHEKDNGKTAPNWQQVARRAATQYEFPQGSACFILSVEDDMESILNLALAEAMLFKYGSGAGTNLSTLRSTREKLTGGGKPSGPLSFLKIYDQVAGTIKSGGKTRRAAKWNGLNDLHPDIEEFIEAKSKEERKAWALIEQGYDPSYNGEAYGSIMYQNENLTVRCRDEFMAKADDWLRRGMPEVEGDAAPLYWTKRVTDGKDCEQKHAGHMLRKMAEGVHVCGDPGIQFDDTINAWHTCPGTDRQHATNPCSEYLFLDNTACNLSSLNLLKFKSEDGHFRSARFRSAVDIMILAQELIVDNASYPTEAIAVNSHVFRTLGLGYANLGALLMSYGLGYDSDAGRAACSAITSTMTGEAYTMSAVVAARMGAFPGYDDASCFGITKPVFASNVDAMLEVMAKHQSASLGIDKMPGSREAANRLGLAVFDDASDTWDHALTFGAKHGYRNAQTSVIAPTGTIGFLMDCDTTGIEPDIALVKYKLLAGGGMLKIVNQTIPAALQTLGYAPAEITVIIGHVHKYDTIEDIAAGTELPGGSVTPVKLSSGLRQEHISIFDCAFKAHRGTRSLHYRGHIQMMAAAQPFLSGAISKTVNIPETATVEDIMRTYVEGWKLGLKAIAIYRDGSKRSAPLNVRKTKDMGAVEVAQEAITSAIAGADFMDEIAALRAQLLTLETAHGQPVRKKLPTTRVAVNHKFEIGEHKGYINYGLYEDGTLGEIFIQMSKEGSTIGGLMDTIATLTSMALQYGVPLSALVKKFAYQRFEPAGFTKNPDVRNAFSIVDYVFRYLGCQFLDGYREQTAPRPLPTMADPIVKPETETKTEPLSNVFMDVVCSNCGSSKVIRAGACGCCTECGTSQGCS